MSNNEVKRFNQSKMQKMGKNTPENVNFKRKNKEMEV